MDYLLFFIVICLIFLLIYGIDLADEYFYKRAIKETAEEFDWRYKPYRYLGKKFNLHGYTWSIIDFLEGERSFVCYSVINGTKKTLKINEEVYYSIICNT